LNIEEAIEAGIEHSTDPEYPRKQGADAVHRYFEEKLRTAEEAGNNEHASYILYNWLTNLPAWDGRRDYFLQTAHRMLSLPPQSVQLTLYLARWVFDEFDDPQLALDLIEHSYSIIVDTESALDNLNYLRLSKILILDILASHDPWSDETKSALVDVGFLCGTYREFDDRLIESMATITSRQSDNWLETRMQKSILKRIWGQAAADERFDITDRTEQMARVENLISKIPVLPIPDDVEDELEI
jgi:hypothetical protein